MSRFSAKFNSRSIGTPADQRSPLEIIGIIMFLWDYERLWVLAIKRYLLSVFTSYRGHELYFCALQLLNSQKCYERKTLLHIFERFHEV